VGQATQKKGNNPSRQEAAVTTDFAPPLIERRWFLVTLLVGAVVTAIGIPIFFLETAHSCDTGDPLIDAACMAERREAEAVRLGKNKRINIRPKKQPFKVVDDNFIGGLSQPSPSDR
jgi:hypothetical protein